MPALYVHPDADATTVSINHHPQVPLTALSLAALGVIYGDIGTSPLYTINECFFGNHRVPPDVTNILGILSLVFWSLTVEISLKYVVFLLRADNKGEGGTFSLLATLNRPLGRFKRWWHVLALLAAAGAALLYGDGVITPAISVLSAVEGLNLATEAAAPYVVPITCVILLILFTAQRYGTAVIGKIFGPVMVIWFLTLGILGLHAIILQPDVLKAFNPWYAYHFFMVHHLHGFISLASVVLCITGGEALYADMGHFGRRPIRITWYGIVMPGLLLNYFGQGAMLIHAPEIAKANPFYALAPHALLYPMVALATVSTIIASQAMISGVFSLTQQAIQLGFAPRMRIVHTSKDAKGQIYIPMVNWLVMIACLTLVLVFQASSRLASAYGIAVTATMTITSILYFHVIRFCWRWKLWQCIALIGLFLLFDGAFLGANVLKIKDGGWVTLSIAAVILTGMITWRDGRALLAKYYAQMRLPTEIFLKDLAKYAPQRTPGTAVFMSISPEGIPHTLLHQLKHNEALHRRILLLSIVHTEFPTVPPDNHVVVKNLGQGFYRVQAFYGFMESPDMEHIIEELNQKGLHVDIYTTSFFLGRESLLPSGPAHMAGWRKRLFIFMSRNAWNASSYFKLPPDRVVELGNQVEL